MRPRSLLPGVLGRGRERTSHPRARSLSARPMCPASLPPASCHPRRSGITGTVEALLREVRVQIGHKGLQPLFTEPHEPRNHAVLSDALSTRCRLCIRFGHSPPLQGPLDARNHTGGRSPAITVTRAHPDPDGTPHLTPPPRPSRGPSRCCRAGPTSTDQVAGSCGRSCSDSLGP